MNWLRRLMLLAALPVALFAGASATDHAIAQTTPQGGDLTVSLSVAELSTRLGDTSEFSSTIINNSDVASGTLIANLNFVATDGTTFVDPEDWSGERTVEVGSIAPHASAVHAWTIKSVVKGDVVAYVVVLLKPPQLKAASTLVSSPSVQIHVEEHRALNPGGVLPVALAVPAVLAVAFGGLQVMRRRT